MLGDANDPWEAICSSIPLPARVGMTAQHSTPTSKANRSERLCPLNSLLFAQVGRAEQNERADAYAVPAQELDCLCIIFERHAFV